MAGVRRVGRYAVMPAPEYGQPLVILYGSGMML